MDCHAAPGAGSEWPELVALHGPGARAHFAGLLVRGPGCDRRADPGFLYSDRRHHWQSRGMAVIAELCALTCWTPMVSPRTRRVPMIQLACSSLFLGIVPLTAFIQKWPLYFTVYLPNVLIIGVVVQVWEEGGWPGYAVPTLQRRFGGMAHDADLRSTVGLVLSAFLLCSRSAFPD